MGRGGGGGGIGSSPGADGRDEVFYTLGGPTLIAEEVRPLQLLSLAGP